MTDPRLTRVALAACLAWAGALAAAATGGAATGPAQATASPAATAAPTLTSTPPPATVPPNPSPTPADAATATATAPATTVAVSNERPVLVLMGSSASPAKPGPGGTFQLDLYVANKGESDARDVQLALSSDTFVARLGGSVLYKDKIKDGEDETLSVHLTVADAATPGVHALSIAMRYEDGDGQVYTDQATLGIEVSASAQQPVVVVQAVRMPGRVAPGIPFTLALDLANTGSQPATNVVVAPAAGPLALSGGGPAPVAIPAGGAATVALRVAATSPEAPGAASQTLDLRFNGPTGQAFTASHVIGLVITGGAATDPLPMVTGYRAGEGLSLHPGQVFELALDITNVGVADALRTVLALGGGTTPASTSGATGGTSGGSGGASLGVFAPLGTSNLRHLGHLPAGDTVTVLQRMVVDGAAKPGAYVLEVDLSYVDANGQALANSEVISLVVTRPVDLAITATNPVTSTVAGEDLPFPVEVLNRGANTVTVKEVAVRGPDSVTVTDGSRYVGELDAGASDTIEAVLTPGEAGEATIEVTARYLDDLNNEQAVTEAFTLTVTAAPTGPDEDEAETQPEQGNLFLRVLKGLLGLGASPPLAITAATESSSDNDAGAAPAGNGALRARPAPAQRAAPANP